MLLTDGQIREAMAQQSLQIDNFSEDCLQAASYDMCLGEEAITSSSREKINPADKGLLTIAAGDFALVTTHERVRLSPRTAGHIGLRSHYARKGLILLSGPQIDPGFQGVLVVGINNVSPSDLVIPYKERFCTVEFYQLNEDAKRPYEGEYQSQAGISGTDLELLAEAKGMTFGQVISTLNALTMDVKSLADSVNSLRTSITVGIGAIGVLLAVGIAVIGTLTAID
jgi:dCTP deaminase